MPRLASMFKSARSTPALPNRDLQRLDIDRDAPPSSFKLKSSPPQTLPQPIQRGHNRVESVTTPVPARPLLRSRSQTTSDIDSQWDAGGEIAAVRRRPSALRLRTSNLDSPFSKEPLATSSKTSPQLPRHCPIPTSDKLSVYGPVEVLGADDSTPRPESPAATALSPQLVKSPSGRSASADNLHATIQVSDKPGEAYMKHSRSDSSLCSSAPFTATTRTFDNVPLPWSAQPVEQLSEMLGERGIDELVDFTLSHLPPRPNLLPPSLLRTGASEEARLRGELARLREKYDRLMQQRDTLFHQLEHSLIKTDLSTVQRALASFHKAMGRCDRIARQMYVCNDQIRQIELQGESHIVGALQIALAKERASADPSSAVPTPPKSSALLSGFDFPLPPNRSEVEIDTPNVVEPVTASPNEILIFPPHRRSLSAPLLPTIALPHSPWRPAPPLSTSDDQVGTLPLRIVVPKIHRTRSKSMVVRTSEPSIRERRGRDTQLQTAESILLSLATAELWTKAHSNA